MSNNSSGSIMKNRWFILFIISAGAGMIYQLPYLRYSYYDAMIEAFAINNTQLGNIMSAFGLGAVFCYALGGIVADRIADKWILSLGQILTGAAGFLFATFPPYPVAMAISFYWAFSSCLIFWPSMINFVRSLGNASEQGKIYGLLEALRGIIATSLSLALVGLFNKAANAIGGLRAVIIAYAIISIVLGVITFFVVPYEKKQVNVDGSGKQVSILQTFLSALKLKKTWQVTLIIFCTCFCYDCLGYTTPYLSGVLGASTAFVAIIGTIRTWGLQVAGGLSAGAISGKFKSNLKTIILGFAIIAIGFGVMIVLPPSPGILIPVTILVLLFGTAIFINRGVYFATTSEIGVTAEQNAMVVAFASAIGFLPDAFIYTLIGWILDNYTGATGYKMVYGMAVAAAIIGLLVALFSLKENAKKK